METKEEKIIVTTPAGKFLYPKITAPDTKFDSDGMYSIQIVLEPSKARDELVATVKEEYRKICAVADAEVAKKKKGEKAKRVELPLKQEFDEDGNPTGNLVLRAKMKASGKKKNGEPWEMHPGIFDAKGKPIPPKTIRPWTGTVGKLSIELSPFYTPGLGAGVSSRLQAVQILQLVEGGERSASSYGFGEEEGWHSEPEDEFPENGNGVEDADPRINGRDPEPEYYEDDIPF